MTDPGAAIAKQTTEIDDGVTKKGRRFDSRDWQMVADYIHEEAERRKDDPDRKHMVKVWKEIDRQLRMEPDARLKRDIGGQPIKGYEWMAEMEVPNQSQTLEVLTSDARKLMFPDAGLWFEAHVHMTDEWLQKVDFKGLVSGDETEVPSQINQENADKLIEGWLDHYHRQYDFRGAWDRLHAEAFKYGTLVGRLRMVTRSVQIEKAQGVVKRDQKIPTLVPQSVKYTLLDKSPQVLMNEGMMVGPAPIRMATQKLVDLQMAAAKGSNDPDNMDGGWMAANTKGLIADKTGSVELLEYEGDLVVPRKTTRSMFIPNVVVTVAVGANGPKVVRFRFNKTTFGSYLIQPYHIEGADEVYGVSPLMKGMPIQKALSDALNRLCDWAALNTQPPISYQKDDPFFASTGGPIVAPRELWGSLGDVKTQQIGDGKTFLAIYQELRRQYDDVTGVNAPRLGAQTVSHTTAFAKNVEMQKGQSRTVDYIDTVLTGAATRWLNMEFELAKMAMGTEETFFIEEYGGWVDLKKSQLPDMVMFNAYGAGEPAEEQARLQKKIAGLQMAMQIDGLKKQYGVGQPLNYDHIQLEILREAGWTDVQPFIAQAPSAVPPGTGPVAAVPSPALGIGQTSDTALETLLGQ